MIFDPRDRAFALSAPIPGLPAVPEPTALGEFMLGLQASFRAFQAEEQSVSRNRMLGEALQPYLDAYQAETGEALDNPYDAPATDTFDEATGRPRRDPLVSRERRLDEIFRKYSSARDNPGDRLTSRLPQLPDEGGLLELAKKRALQLSDADERASAVRALGSAGTVGTVLGTLGGAVQDPVNIAAMALGAPAAAGIVRTMAIEAALGAGAEAIIQPGVARWKAELGKEHGFSDMLANVAAGAIGAGALAGVIKGGARVAGIGYERLRSSFTREQRQAIEALDSLDVYERRDPFQLALRIRKRAERTGEEPRATFGEVLRAGDEQPIEVNLERLRAEAGETAPAPRDPELGLERVDEPSVLDVLGDEDAALDISAFARDAAASKLERVRVQMSPEHAEKLRAAGVDVDPNGVMPRSEAARLADAGQPILQRQVARIRERGRAARAAREPAETRALHMAAVGEAEASVALGRMPEGPAIDAVNDALPWDEIELPVYAVQTRKGRTVRRRGPMDIVTWLRAVGGLKDDAGELAARDLTGNKGGTRGGRQQVEFAGGEGSLGRLTHPEGMTLDDATLAAWEAGYFAGRTERPTPDDLLDAIDRTIAAGNDIDRRVWSEHDAGLIDRLRGRIDPDEEAASRAALGGAVVDDALDVLDSEINLAVDPDTVVPRAWEDPDAPAVDLDDPVEVATLEALQRELDAGDFEVVVDQVDEATGQVAQVRRSAREVWRDTETDVAALQDAAACMSIGATAGAA